MTNTEVIEWLEKMHYDLFVTATLMKPRWVVGDRHTGDEIGEGHTICEAVSRARMQLLKNLDTRNP